jgi:hypothetical protein
MKKEAILDPETGDLLQATIPKIIAYLTSARGGTTNHKPVHRFSNATRSDFLRSCLLFVVWL